MGKAIFYSDRFEQLWKAYAGEANGSKKMANAAYLKAGNDLPPHDLLLCCVEAYREFLKANSKPGRVYPQAHLTTFLNQGRYEGFLERGEELLRIAKGRTAQREATVAATSTSWPTSTLNKLALSPAIVEKWFLPTVLEPGPPPRILAPTKFHAEWLQTKFYSKIEQALGPGVIVKSAS